MAEAKAVKKAVEATPPENEKVGEFTLVHSGHGRYKIEGYTKEFGTRRDAVSYLEDLERVAAYERTFGDVVPEGIEVRHRTLVYQDTLLELPMNMNYLPDGAHSPYYDRAYFWGWGGVSGSDIADKQARGYRVVTREELEAAVDIGTVPEHYLSFLLSTDHGNRLQYGDLVLMRQPRVLWRQQRAQDEAQALRRISRQDDANSEIFEKAGVSTAPGPIRNEVSTGLKISGFDA